MSAFRLEASGLRYERGGRLLLDGIDLAASPGETVAVTGPSGAGKTSLLMILAGVMRPDEGSVRYRREDEGAPSRKAIVSFVPQTLGLSPTSTAQENVALALQVQGIDTTEMRGRVQSSLAAVGLAGQPARLVTELSGGQRQRVAVARALALRPDILVADEATAELDGENQRIVMDLLLARAEAGVAVVLSTHDPLVAERCTKVHLLEDGALRIPEEAAAAR